MYTRGRGISLFWLLYLIVGVIIASDRNYFKGVDTVEEIISAVLAITLWPLILLDVNLHIQPD